MPFQDLKNSDDLYKVQFIIGFVDQETRILILHFPETTEF